MEEYFNSLRWLGIHFQLYAEEYDLSWPKLFAILLFFLSLCFFLGITNSKPLLWFYCLLYLDTFISIGVHLVFTCQTKPNTFFSPLMFTCISLKWNLNVNVSYIISSNTLDLFIIVVYILVNITTFFLPRKSHYFSLVLGAENSYFIMPNADTSKRLHFNCNI